VFTYYLDAELLAHKKARRKAEIEAEKKGDDTPYPSWDTLRAEDREEGPSLLLIVKDANGNTTRQIEGDTEEGLHRTAWDLRLPPTDPVTLEVPETRPYWESAPRGPLAVPGDYTVTLAKREDGELIELA